MKEQSLFKNAIWNFLYTGMNLLFPILTSPYVSRILGAENVGKVEFAKSFSTWFVLFAAFGITLYGVREIAKARDDEKELSKVFSELFLINFIFSIISVVIYIIVVFSGILGPDDRTLFLIMTISIILNSFNIDWFYQGIEVYNYITLRNGVIKLVSLFAIFMLVTNKEDYNMYALISVLGTGLSGIWNVVYSRKFVNISLVNVKLLKHMTPLTIFFLSIIVTNLYTNADTTLLGFLSDPESVAFMQRAKSIKGVATAASLSIISVIMPRASFYIKNNFQQYERLLIQVPRLLMFFSAPISMILFVLSEEALFVIGGVEFIVATKLMQIISITILLSAFSTLLQQQVLIPSGRERFGLIASIISGVTSVILNLLLIPKMGYIGSGIALFAAEFLAVIVRYYYCKKIGYSFLKLIDRYTLKYILASILMIIPILIIRESLESYLITIISSMIICPIIYLLILIIFRDQTIFNLWSRIRN